MNWHQTVSVALAVALVASCSKGGSDRKVDLEEGSKESHPLTAISDGDFGKNQRYSFDSWKESIHLEPDGEEEHKELVAMIRRLGHERVEEAVPFLLENLTKVHGNHLGSFTDSLDFRSNYPCSYALEKIGEPAVDGLRDIFLTGADWNSQTTAYMTLLRISPEDTESWINNIPSHPTLPDETFEGLKRLAASKAKRTR